LAPLLNWLTSTGPPNELDPLGLKMLTNPLTPMNMSILSTLSTLSTLNHTSLWHAYRPENRSSE
jgi:hypothetical protein